jgi:hypothetical protein
MGVQVLSKVESNLQCIIYLSTATKSMTDVEIEDLLVSARKFNATQNVTGILFYLDGNFVQYIEGTEDALHKVYQRITRSSVHKNIVQKVKEPIAIRNFPHGFLGATTISKYALFKLQQMDGKEKFNNGLAIVRFLKAIIELEHRNLRFSSLDSVVHK